ncbi:citrulline utilization hydrolase CtlX [Bacteroidota bacterium]
MSKYIAAKILMIKPVNFGFNISTVETNVFQKNISDFLTCRQIQELALLEFENAVQILKKEGIEVIVYEDTFDPLTPDSIFPNNWFATFPDGNLLTFPMAVKNRANERRSDIIEDLKSRFRYKINRSLEVFENENLALEGTGSLVFAHFSKIGYAALSLRTNVKVIEAFSKITDYEIVTFQAFGPQQEPIYHTNVMMCMTDQFALIGTETISPEEREKVMESIKNLGKEIIILTNEQIYKHFAGNMIQLQNANDEKLLIMSSNAYQSLTQEQLELLSSFNHKLVSIPVNMIETIGGGSIRCMIAEIF